MSSKVARPHIPGAAVVPHAPSNAPDIPLGPPIPTPQAADLAAVLAAAAAGIGRGAPGAMATVLERHGSAPGTPGQKLYLAADGTCVGSVGGGAVEHAVLKTLGEMLKDPRAKHAVRTFKLGAELGMCCGGRLEVLVEPINALIPTLIIGGGHVATALAPILSRVGFGVTVVDEREEWAQPGRIPNVTFIAGEFDDVGDVVPAESGICLVMTHDHQLDQAAIEWALKRGYPFVGGVGSRAKAERTRQRLDAKGFRKEECDRIRMPLGVDIGARSPEEIAIAIAAELISWRKTAR